MKGAHGHSHADEAGRQFSTEQLWRGSRLDDTVRYQLFYFFGKFEKTYMCITVLHYYTLLFPGSPETGYCY